MKRYLISTITAISILCMALSVSGQEQEKARQRDNVRKRLQNMTEEEKRQYTTQMRQKTGVSRLTTGREQQLKAIETIQEQLVKLKTAILSLDDEAIRRFGELPEQEQTALRDNMTKATQARWASLAKIDEQLIVLRGPVPQKSEQPMPIRELKMIHWLAKKEKATETADRIQKLLNRYQKESVSPRTREPGQTPERSLRGPVQLELEKQPKEQPAKQGSKK